MLATIGVLVWLFLPVAANMAPLFAKKIPIIKHLSAPMDMKKTFRGKRIFGANKTFRGLAAGGLLGASVGLLQFILAKNFSFFANITDAVDYTSPIVIMFGLIIGIASLLGDAAESFIKRQLDKKPGESWFPFDQIDFIIGAFAASLLFFSLPISHYILGIFMVTIIHPVVKFSGWLIGLEDKPF